MPAAAADTAGRDTLERYARDTWHSFVAMVEPSTGLPADNIGGDLAPAPGRLHLADEHRHVLLGHVRCARPRSDPAEKPSSASR